MTKKKTTKKPAAAAKPAAAKPAAAKPKAMTDNQVDALVCERLDRIIIREGMSGLFVRGVSRACLINEKQAQDAISKRITMIRDQLQLE